MAYKPSKLTLSESIDLIKEIGGSENAKGELTRAGDCGDFTATGLIITVFGGVPWPEKEGDIPPRFWRYEIYWDANQIRQTPLGRIVHVNKSEEAREIRIKRSDLEAIWGGSDRWEDSEDHQAGNPSPAIRGFSPTKVTDAYIERVENWPEDKRPPDRDDDLLWARENFGEGVPRDLLRKLRRENAPENWRKRSRSRTNNQEQGGQNLLAKKLAD